MSNTLFHVFRNTPFGRDSLLQSIFFAKRLGLYLMLYIPKHSQFLMYFAQKAVTVDLNKFFLYDPDTARAHAENLLEEHQMRASFFEPRDFTAISLPDVPVNFKYMCCPRSIVDLSTKIGMGYIGPKVRQIVRFSSFPVLIPTTVFKEWNEIMVFFGGSKNAIRAMEVAIELHEKTDLPLKVFTKAEHKPKEHYEEILDKNSLLGKMTASNSEWLFFKKGSFRQQLFEVPSSSLIVAGSYGHGLAKDLVFGSRVEEIQHVLPNNMLIVGSN